MIVTGLVLVSIAALVHVYIFVLESLLWMSPDTRRTFGIRTVEEAETMRVMAFNQGFYNLFLAIMVTIGVTLYLAGESVVGATLVFAGAGSMVLAAIVLFASSPRMLKAALIQGLVPLLGIVALVVGLVV